MNYLNPEITSNRRKLLISSAGSAILLPLTACGSQVDTIGLSLEATATAKAAPSPTPKPPSFHEQMLSRLMAGNKIDIWEGTFKFANDLNRRDTNSIPARQETSGEGWSCDCRPGPVYRPSWNRYELVTNPLRVKGNLYERGLATPLFN